MRHRALALAALLAASALCGCQTEESLDGLVKDALGEVDLLMGGKNVPATHIAELESYHVEGTWQFRADVSDPLEKTREAVRDLAVADYADWNESALTVRILTSMIEGHPAGLVRLEALDSLTSIGAWTIESTVDNGDWAEERDVIRSVKTLRDALENVQRGQMPTDEGNLVLADALDTIAAFDFPRRAGDPFDDDVVGFERQINRRRGTAAGVLRVLTGESMRRLQVAPVVRSAMDRALVNVAAATIRLTLADATLADDTASVRTNGARSLGVLVPPHGALVLAAALRSDRDSAVRREAARSLAAFAPEDALPPLVEALFDDVPSVRSTAVRSLTALTGENLGDDRAAWVRWLESRRASSEATPEAGASDAETR